MTEEFSRPGFFSGERGKNFKFGEDMGNH